MTFLRPSPFIIGAFDVGVTVTTGDNKARFPVPQSLSGYWLVGAHAYVGVAGTTGTTDVQIYNVGAAADMLSTKLTIDSGETSSRTAATAAVIDINAARVVAGDILRIDVDAVQTTPPTGLWLELEFGERRHAA